jgi:fused signal recognition particle receptor
MAETKGLFRRVFGGDAAACSETADAASHPSFFARLKQGLTRSSNALSDGITAIFTKRKLDEAALGDFEDMLIKADLGVDTAARIAGRLREDRFDREVTDEEVKSVLAAEIVKTLEPVALPLVIDASLRPHVILVVGVNGTGKTTTIGKLAAKLTAESKSVMLAAGDTFRAAAIEQLKIWGLGTREAHTTWRSLSCCSP